MKTDIIIILLSLYFLLFAYIYNYFRDDFISLTEFIWVCKGRNTMIPFFDGNMLSYRNDFFE
jgi:hypothetical protein